MKTVSLLIVYLLLNIMHFLHVSSEINTDKNVVKVTNGYSINKKKCNPRRSKYKIYLHILR